MGAPVGEASAAASGLRRCALRPRRDPAAPPPGAGPAVGGLVPVTELGSSAPPAVGRGPAVGPPIYPDRVPEAVAPRRRARQRHKC